jgi:hypothetical protein
MSTRNGGLTADPLFVGATRPPMRWGVTYAALLFNMVFTLVENCGNTLILRCSGSEHGGTSQFASRLIGEREVTRITTSRSRRLTDFVPSITRAEHLGIESAVMGSEIEQLPDLSGYLKLASTPVWRMVRLSPAAAAARPSATPSSARILSFPARGTARRCETDRVCTADRGRQTPHPDHGLEPE